MGTDELKSRLAFVVRTYQKLGKNGSSQTGLQMIFTSDDLTRERKDTINTNLKGRQIKVSENTQRDGMEKI